MQYRTCKKCGRVHYGITALQATLEMDSFNAYYATLTPEQQQELYGGKGATLADYQKCFGCGNDWRNFRDSLPGDCPDGVTLSPIIAEDL